MDGVVMRAAARHGGGMPPVDHPARAVGVRARWETGNKIVDEVVTRLTGKALPNQKALFDLGGAGWWLVSTAALALFWTHLVIAIWSIPQAGALNVLLVPAALAAMLVVIGRLRAQQVVFGHHAVHGTISKRWSWLNAFVKHFATAISLSQSPEDYRSDHVKKHHRFAYFTTLFDPDAALLLLLGFRPGMTRAALYSRLWATIVSPRFHYMFVRSRFKSALLTADAVHQAAVLFWLSILAILATVMPWWVFILTIVVPLGPLYHVSALLQFLTEHRWLASSGGADGLKDYASRCCGRFAIVAPPAEGLSLRTLPTWGMWALRFAFEIAIRLSVWVGDLPAHDHHHVVGHVGHDAHDWHEALFERQRSIDEGDPLDLAARELHGLKAALDWVFDGLSNAKA